MMHPHTPSLARRGDHQLSYLVAEYDGILRADGEEERQGKVYHAQVGEHGVEFAKDMPRDPAQPTTQNSAAQPAL